MGDKVRHTTERGSRSGGQIPRYRLPQASVGYDNLAPALRRDVTASRMAARAVQAEKKVWDRARAITEQGTFLVEKLEGLISEAQLEQAVRETLDRVPVVEGMLADVTGRVETAEASIEDLGDQITLKADKSVLDAVAQRVTTAEARLDVLADEISAKVSQEDFDLLAGRVSTAEATLQIHAGEIAAKASQQEVDLLAGRVTQAEADIVATAGLIQSEVSRIEGRLGSSDPSVWYSSIKQTADEIESVVAMLNSDAQATGQFSSIKQTADAIDFVVSTLNEAPDAPTQFSSIKQTVQEISSIVALLNSDPDAADQFSAITQLASEIDLRVHKDEVITAINLSPEGVAIQANKVEFLTQPIPKAIPQGATLFHFDHGLRSTGGLSPESGYVATLRPGEGRFGGAVAVEEGTTNLLGTLSPKGGAKVTTEITHYTNEPVFYCDGSADWQGIRADQRVTLTAGTEYTFSVYVYNPSTGEGSLNIQIDSDEVSNEGIGTAVVPPGPGWHRIVRKWSPPANRNVSAIRFENRTRASWQSGSNRCYMTAPQVEAKPFATSFVAGTRAAGKLDYNLPLTNPHTGHLWMYAPYRIESVYYGGAAKDNSPLFELIDEATGYHLEFETWHNRPFIDPEIGTYTSHRHKDWIPEAHTWYGITWKLLPDNFIVEVRDVSGNLIQTWDAPSSEFAGFHPTQLRLGVFGGAVLIDELLILPYAASEEEIRSWYEQAAPFYDPAQQLQALDNQIWMDSTGLNMQNVAVQNKLMNLNANRLAFWDANGEVVAGMGNIDDLIQQLDPDATVPGMGVIIAQGAFLATQGVLRRSIADFSISREKLGDGSIDRNKISDGAVGYAQLFTENLSVVDTQAFVLHSARIERVEVRSSSWSTYFASTITEDDVCESVRIDTGFNVFASAGSTDTTLFLQVLINGIAVYGDSATWRAGTAGDGKKTIYIDVRGIDGQKSITFQVRRSGPGYGTIKYVKINKNSRYALIAAPPSYAVEQSEGSCVETCEATCQTPCQFRCETSCQNSCQTICEDFCQTACQNSCQTTCQDSCQSTCEKTAQGGCFVDGTPVTVYDPETGEISEIPIEDLKPGMFMPYYEPQTDRVMISECVSNEPSITATLYEITVEAPNEPIVLRATPEQPFDVWRKNRLTGEWGWSVIPAQYLKPGDKMIRPFDEGNRMPNVISVVKLPPQPPTRVWDPKTVARRYIVAGFADAFSKH